MTSAKFAVLYRFVVTQGREAEFARAWSEVTLGIRDERGSFGSCLHRAEDGSFVAYARWPDRKTWESAPIGSGSDQLARAKMRECCDEVEVLHMLDVETDLLSG